MNPDWTPMEVIAFLNGLAAAQGYGDAIEALAARLKEINDEQEEEDDED